MDDEAGCSEEKPKESSSDDEGEEDGDTNPRNGGSSSNSTVEEDERKVGSGAVRQYIRSNNPRLRWTPDLHLSFVHAVERLGGQDRATPKLILQLMNVKGLSIAHVKSHLQMYRSKKMDDSGRVINEQGNLMDRAAASTHPYNLRQLPVLQGLYQGPLSTSRYEHSLWFRHGSWIRNPYLGRDMNVATGSGFPGSAADMLFGSSGGLRTVQDLHRSNNSTLDDKAHLRLFEAHENLQLLHHHHRRRHHLFDGNHLKACPSEPGFTGRQPHGREEHASRASRSTGEEVEWRRRGTPSSHHEAANMARWRNSDDCGLDLTLSLKVSTRNEKERGQWEDEEADSSLTLSLYPPAKRKDVTEETKLSKLIEEDDSWKPDTETSTRHLTI